MFAEQEEDTARLNEIYQRVNKRHEKMEIVDDDEGGKKKTCRYRRESRTTHPWNVGMHRLFKLNADDMFELEMMVDRDHDGKIDYAMIVDFESSKYYHRTSGCTIIVNNIYYRIAQNSSDSFTILHEFIRRRYILNQTQACTRTTRPSSNSSGHA